VCLCVAYFAVLFRQYHASKPSERVGILAEELYALTLASEIGHDRRSRASAQAADLERRFRSLRKSACRKRETHR